MKIERASQRRRLVAFFSLGLVFLAGVVFSFEYFDTASAAPAEAQTAAAAVPDAPNPFLSLNLLAHCAIVIDLSTGKVLYSLNPDTQWPLASLTKIALVLAVSQALPPDTLITTPQYTAPPSGGTSRLPGGETWTLHDAIDFTLAVSSNDGADLLAQAANSTIHQEYPQSPAQDATLWRMNDLAQQLHLTSMYFLDDNGLDLSTTQSGAYGSARDVAELFAYAASTSPETFAATTRQSFNVTSIDGASTTAVNTDEALPAIPGIVMGKTGYTDLSGGNLAVVFDAAPGHRIVAVVLGSTEEARFSDMGQLVSATAQAVSDGE